MALLCTVVECLRELKMSKNKVVIFTPNNARIIVTTEPAKYRKMPNALLNPDLSNVISVAPQYWKLQNNKVVEMNHPEKLQRDADIRINGANNIIIELKPSKIYVRIWLRSLPFIYATLFGAILGWVSRG